MSSRRGDNGCGLSPVTCASLPHKDYARGRGQDRYARELFLRWRTAFAELLPSVPSTVPSPALIGMLHRR